MSSEAPEYGAIDYFRAYFQDDTDGWENGARAVFEEEILGHIKTARHITLTADSKKNLRYWLCARYEGYVLHNPDGSLHDSARFLIKMYLKQQKYASPGDDYFNHNASGVRIERDLQASFLRMVDKLGLDVTIPSPYTDMALKTDLILEMTFSRSEKRKIAVQITTNSREKENKFNTIKHLYGGHNGVKISRNYETDDVCLIFMKDGDKDFTQICHDFTQVWTRFVREGQRDIDHKGSWGEVKIHSVRRRKSPHEHNAFVTKTNDIVPAGASRQDTVARLSLPFSPVDFTALQATVVDVVGDKDGIPGRRDERKMMSYFDDETERSYFPGLVKIIQKWWRKGWTLAQKAEKIQVLHGRMSPDDYTKVRLLLTQNSLDLPKKEQKLQEIAEILERWFPGIYECIDCALCANGTADQKKRLLSYKKAQPEKTALPKPDTRLREITPEQEARRKERDERRRTQTQAHNHRMAQEQIMFQKRIKAALDIESEMDKKTEYAKMLKAVVQKLKKLFPLKEKITRKQVERIETAMSSIINIYRKCLELEQQENGTQKILEYLNDFIHRFGDGAK